jgi:hypothetical protein
VSIHAQVEGVGTLEFPDGTDPAVVQATVKKTIAAKTQTPKTPVTPDRELRNPMTQVADTAAALVSGAVAPLAGGIVKAGGYANRALGLETGKDPKTGLPLDPRTTAREVEDALTYTPKTAGGKFIMGKISQGFQKFENWADQQSEDTRQAISNAGKRAAEVAKAHGAPQGVVDFIDSHKDEVANAYATATRTAEEGALFVAGAEAPKVLGAARDLVKPAIEAPPLKPVGTAEAPQPQATPQPSAAPGASPAANVPRETTPQTPLTRAQAYARDRLGLDWNALGAVTRGKLQRVAGDPAGLEKLNPEAVKRQAHLEREGYGRAPIKTTAGRYSRDESQLLKEEGAAGTTSGKPIADTDVQANRTLRKNVEVLIDRLAGVGKSRATQTTKEGVGQAVAGKGEELGVLTKRQKQAQAITKAAYDRARKTEPNARVSPDPMYEFVRGNPEVLNPAVQHLSWLSGWLKKAGIEKVTEEGGLETTERRPIRLEELDDLRKKALSIAKGGGDNAHYAGEVIKAVDKSFEEIPDAAKNWKMARDLHSKERGEFKNQEAIERLVGKKGGAYGTDPKTALEDVWRASFGPTAKIDQVRQFKRSLLSGKDPQTRLEGKQALREMRAQTGRDFLESITKGVSTNSAGETQITAASINQWINKMGGREKLDVIWGKHATNELMKIREDAQITKTSPTLRVSGSNTFTRILNWLDDLGLKGALKDIAGAPVTLAEKFYKAGEGGRIAREALQEPTSAGERAGLAASAPAAPPSAVRRSALTYGAATGGSQ